MFIIQSDRMNIAAEKFAMPIVTNSSVAQDEYMIENFFSFERGRETLSKTEFVALESSKQRN